jgi:hypothetical protein
VGRGGREVRRHGPAGDRIYVLAHQRECVLMDLPGGSMMTISGGVRWARRVKKSQQGYDGSIAGDRRSGATRCSCFVVYADQEKGGRSCDHGRTFFSALMSG